MNQTTAMLRISAAVITTLLATGAAFAADLGGAPFPERSYDPPVSRSAIWTGAYLGINGGGGWGSSREVGGTKIDVDGGLIGVHGGFNYQTGMIVFGVEGDADWANGSGTTALGGGATLQSDLSFLGSIRGRLGLAVDRTLFYGTAGIAFNSLGLEVDQPGSMIKISQSNTGWVAGGGVEFKLNPNVSARVEALHYDFGHQQYNFGGTVPGKFDLDQNVVRAGLTFHFN